MALINCPECNNQVSSIAVSCPHCGFLISKQKYIPPKERLQSRTKILIGVFCILGFIAIGLQDTNKPLKPFTPANTAIANTQQKDTIKDEIKALFNSPDFIYSKLIKNYKEINKTGNETFDVWHEVTVTVGNVKKLKVEYDKKWILKNTLYLTKKEIEKFKNTLDIHSVYWKNNKIQAYIITRYYTDLKQYKVTDIFDRDYLLKILNNDKKG